MDKLAHDIATMATQGETVPPAQVLRLAHAYLTLAEQHQTLQRRIKAPKRVCDNYTMIAVHLHNHPNASIREVQAAIKPYVGDVSRNTVWYHMQKVRAATA